MTAIPTGTGAFFERSKQDIAALRARTEALQEQIGGGARLARSSDDPVAASRLRALMRADQLGRIDTGVADRAGTDLSLTDGALASFADYVTQAKQLAVQAASGTLGNAQRASIGAELLQIHGALVSLANTRDASGHALFGGEATANAYALDAAGNAAYVGTASAGTLPLGDGQSIARGLTGPEVLNFTVNGAPTDLLAVVKSLGDALLGASANPAAAASGALGALDAGLDTVTTQQTIIGTRLAWLDATAERQTAIAEQRGAEQSRLDGADLASTIADLQHAMLVLEASQASFARLAGLSLFDQLR